MKKALIVLMLVFTLVLVAGYCAGKISLPTQSTDVDFPDCDADDKIGKWDTADCGPSPVPVVRRTPAARKTTRR